VTVSAQTTFNTYTGNGVTTVFPYQFKILADTDIAVYVNGVLKTLADYSVTGVGNDVGGSVIFLVAPAAALSVSLVREMDVARSTDYQQAGDFNAATVNPDFDRAILLLQDVHTQLGRSIRTPADEVGSLPTLPSIAVRAGKYAAFDALGLPIASSGTGNDSALRTDLANTVSGVDGSRLVGFRRVATGSVARTAQARLAEVVSVLDFGADPTGASSSQAAFDSARAFAAAAANSVEIVFPAGTYTYATSPNWAIAGITLRAEGQVKLNFTGAGNAWVFDAGASLGQNLYNVRCVGNFIVTGSATATNGYFVRGVHHTTIEGKAKNISGAGLLVNFSVGSTFRVKTTVDSGAFTTTPVSGIKVDKRAAGETTSWCRFEDAVIDSCSGFAIDVQSANGCTFIGNFGEFCAGGVRVDSTNLNMFNTFIGFDCESNTTNADFEIHGQHTHLINCNAQSPSAANNLIIGADAIGTQMIGGYYKIVTLQAGSKRTLFLNSSFLNTGGVTGPGEYRAINCYTVDGSAVFVANVQDVLGDTSTFIPTLIGSTTAGVQTYSTQIGYYLKMGNFVQFQLFVAISAKGGTIAGDVIIGALPFTLKNVANLFANAVIGDMGGFTNTAGRTQFLIRGTPGTSLLRLMEVGSGVAASPVPVTNMAGASYIVISGTYLTD
jgi:hypothetical protein